MQQCFNPIHYILTDQGSQLRQLNQTSRYKPTGEPLRILVLLKEAINTAVFGQRSNLVEGHIKKFKLAIKTLGSAGFQGNCKQLTPEQFELIMEYVKACLELAPFDQTNGTLCPKDFRASSLMAPI